MDYTVNKKLQLAFEFVESTRVNIFLTGKAGTGKSPQEIANERGITLTTIYGHISQQIGTGDIPIEKVVPVKKIAAISQYFKDSNDFHLTSAKTFWAKTIHTMRLNAF